MRQGEPSPSQMTMRGVGQPGTRALIIDDEPTLRQLLRAHLERLHLEVYEASDPVEAELLMGQVRFGLILCDWKMPLEDGLSFIKRLNLKKRRRGLDAEVIFMSAHSAPEVALEAIEWGATDFIIKPINPQELEFRVRKVLSEQVTYAQRLGCRPSEAHERSTALLGRSPEMSELKRTILQVAPTDSTVLITGESGTGKELIARELHRLSPRSERPFVVVNCAAIPESLIDSELFGHVRGAFTDASEERVGLFLEAQQGTIFLDELGELPFAVQGRLLRALEAREVKPLGANHPTPLDVRVIAATHKDLLEEVQRGRFRQDLYYRLNVIHIHSPSLRERAEDIPLLAGRFLERACTVHKRPSLEITEEAMSCLVRYAWPGNVRELENSIEHAAVLAKTDALSPSELPAYVREVSYVASVGLNTSSEGGLLSLDVGRDLSIKRHTQTVERALILQALEQTKWVKTRAAEALDISPKTLLYKMKDYKIEERA